MAGIDGGVDIHLNRFYYGTFIFLQHGLSHVLVKRSVQYCVRRSDLYGCPGRTMHHKLKILIWRKWTSSLNMAMVIMSDNFFFYCLIKEIELIWCYIFSILKFLIAFLHNYTRETNTALVYSLIAYSAFDFFLLLSVLLIYLSS